MTVMKNSRQWLILVVTVLMVIVVEEMRLSWHTFESKSQNRFHLQDLAHLIDQYTHDRMETGTWPDAKDIYGTFFQF
jgi:hypothetical protein